MIKMKKIRTIALIIFVIIVIIFCVIAITERVSGDEELMLCDGCKKSVKMDYVDGLFTEVHLIYEWDD